MSSKLTATIACYSNKGIKAENQDAVGHFVPKNTAMLNSKGIACTLADGVSTSERAKEASQACVTGFLSDYFSTPDSWSVKNSGAKVLSAINTWIFGQNSQFRDSAKGMASTFAAIIVKSTTAHIFHVGDTRIYLWRDNQLEQLTEDHRIHMPGEKEYLGRAMGIDYRLDVDYKSLSVQVGDLFLLATDGVHDYINDAAISSIIKENIHGDLEAICSQIAKRALDQKSLDNISCQIMRIESLPAQDANEVVSQLTELPFPPALREDAILDGYRITRLVHDSSTSQLYQAIDKDTNDIVVIKTPSVSFEDDPAYLEHFQLEEWVGRRIDSPHVIRTIEQKRPRQFLYYVMEYIEGKTLEQWMHDNPKPRLTQMRDIVSQIIKGLRAFHRLDMLHQDLKPGNIMITADGLVKIVDFGSTKIAGIADISTPIERNELLGTKNYTAPEYLLGQPSTNRSDIFSLGIIIYEMLTGKRPYGDDPSKHYTERNLKRLKYTPIIDDSIPHWIDKALRKAVNPQPEQRHGKLSELEVDLKKPNPAFLHENKTPLIERNPVVFWKAIALLAVVGDFVLLYLLNK